MHKRACLFSWHKPILLPNKKRKKLSLPFLHTLITSWTWGCLMLIIPGNFVDPSRPRPARTQEQRAWRATVQGVAERWTPLSPYTADSFRSSTLSGLTTDFSRAFLKNFKHSNFWKPLEQEAFENRTFLSSLVLQWPTRVLDLKPLEVETSWFPLQPDLDSGINTGGKQGRDTESRKSAMVFALKRNRNSSLVQLFQPFSLLCSKSMHAKARLCLDLHIPSWLKFSPELKFLPKPFPDLPTNSFYPKMMFSLPKKHNFMTTLPISITIQYNLCKFLISDFIFCFVQHPTSFFLTMAIT